jgi:hypothetical protein
MKESPKRGGTQEPSDDDMAALDDQDRAEATESPRLLSTESRLELRYTQLTAEIERLYRLNTSLKSQIRGLQLKIRGARLGEERMKEAIAVSQGRKKSVPEVS